MGLSGQLQTALDERKGLTFVQSRDAILDKLESEGWKLSSRTLKIPHATSLDGDLRLWFKAQAVHYTKNGRGYRHSMGDAHTLAYDLDIRKMTPEQFIQVLKRRFPKVAIGEALDETVGTDASKLPTEAYAIYRTFTADYRTQIEWAHDKEGHWFKRFQERHPRYGYRWGKWKPAPSPPRLISTHPATTKKARLPKW